MTAEIGKLHCGLPTTPAAPPFYNPMHQERQLLSGWFTASLQPICFGEPRHQR